MTKVFDDATLVAERRKSPKAHGRLVAAARAIHPDIFQVYDLHDAPAAHISLLFHADGSRPLDADGLAAGLVEFARRFTPDLATPVARITANTDRTMLLHYSPDGTRARLEEGTVVHSSGTLTSALVDALAIAIKDAEDDAAFLAAEAEQP